MHKKAKNRVLQPVTIDQQDLGLFLQLLKVLVVNYTPIVYSFKDLRTLNLITFCKFLFELDCVALRLNS